MKPKKQKQQSKHEVRVRLAPQKFEIRKNADGSRSVQGYFATWGTISHDLGFREVLQQGCFSQSLKKNPVACFRDHNAEMLLGKTQSSTLTVSEDDKGLAFRVKLPDTSYANDLVALMDRGDSYECSFAFRPLPDGETWSQLANGEVLRTITNAVLFEGSILTGNPAAYPNTEASLRNAPKSIRAALKSKSSKRESDEDDEDYDDGICDPTSDNYDEEACNERNRSRRSECECQCDSCLADDCSDCSDPTCEGDGCIDCGMSDDEERMKRCHLELLLRRLKN